MQADSDIASFGIIGGNKIKVEPAGITLQGVINGDIDLNNHFMENCPDPIDPQDVANERYVTKQWKKTLMFNGKDSNYVKSGVVGGIVVGYFRFPGTTSVFSPTAIYSIMWNKDAAKRAKIVIYDLTNANEIANFEITANTPTIGSDTTLTNLPTGTAIFEVQLWAPDGGEARLSSLEVD